MTSPYGKDPVTTIEEVLERQHEIADYIHGTLGDGDGIWIFNDLYITITEQVKKGCDKSNYKDTPFMTALDVAFANRYLEALRDNEKRPGSESGPWKALINARGNPNLQKLQFAAAGVNAHINFDLAQALCATWKQVKPTRGTDQHETYQAIDAVFAAEMDRLRHEFENKVEARFDRGLVSKLLDLVGDLFVDETRNVAWAQARTMWALRDVPFGDDPSVAFMLASSDLAAKVILHPLF